MSQAVADFKMNPNVTPVVLHSKTSEGEAGVLKYLAMPIVDLINLFVTLEYNPNDKSGPNSFQEYDLIFNAVILRSLYNQDQVKADETKELRKIVTNIFLKLKNTSALTSSELAYFLLAQYRSDHEKIGRMAEFYGYLPKVRKDLEDKFPMNPFCNVIIAILYSNVDGNYDKSFTLLKLAEHQNVKIASFCITIFRTPSLGSKITSKEAIQSYEKFTNNSPIPYFNEYVSLLLRDLPFNIDKLFNSLLVYKKLIKQQNIFKDVLPNCGIQYNPQTKQFDCDYEAFNIWILNQSIKASNGDNPVKSWKDLPNKIYQLITTDLVIFEKAIRDARQTYHQRKTVHGRLLTKHEQDMINWANTLESQFQQIQNKNITLDKLIETLENFFDHSGGGTRNNSLKFLIMDNLLRYYAGNQYESAKVSWYDFNIDFVSQIFPMIKMAKWFKQNYLDAIDAHKKIQAPPSSHPTMVGNLQTEPTKVVYVPLPPGAVVSQPLPEVKYVPMPTGVVQQAMRVSSTTAEVQSASQSFVPEVVKADAKTATPVVVLSAGNGTLRDRADAKTVANTSPETGSSVPASSPVTLLSAAASVASSSSSADILNGLPALDENDLDELMETFNDEIDAGQSAPKKHQSQARVSEMTVLNRSQLGSQSSRNPSKEGECQEMTALIKKPKKAKLVLS